MFEAAFPMAEGRKNEDDVIKVGGLCHFENHIMNLLLSDEPNLRFPTPGCILTALLLL